MAQPGPDGKVGTADDIALLGPGDSGDAEYLVEGLREGSHVVEMQMTGTLTGLPVGPVTITGRAAGAVLGAQPEVLAHVHASRRRAGRRSVHPRRDGDQHVAGARELREPEPLSAQRERRHDRRRELARDSRAFFRATPRRSPSTWCRASRAR
ncbi:MAG: hypothetical protein QM736_03595 [Vicinamibacterales bacterium]